MAVVGMALEQRGARGVIHHSDRGSQYISITFGDRCREAGAVDDGADLDQHQGGVHPHPQVRRLDKALHGAPSVNALYYREGWTVAGESRRYRAIHVTRSVGRPGGEKRSSV